MRRTYPKFATIFSIASHQCRTKGLEAIPDLIGDLLPSEKIHGYLGEHASELAVRLFGNASYGNRMLDQHSHFRVLGRLLERDEECTLAESVLIGGFAHRRLFDEVRSLGGMETRTLRSCRHCVTQDEQRYGIAHWRLFHQWPGVQLCPDHGGLLEEECAACGHQRRQGNTPLLPSDPCEQCGSSRFQCREEAEFPVEEQMAHVLFDLLGISDEDANRHRPRARYTSIAAARLAWYEAGEEGNVLLRAADALNCHDVAELAERLECVYKPIHSSGDLLSDDRIAPILIIAGIATATLQPYALFATHFRRPSGALC